MINVSVSQGISSESRYSLNFTPESIQLALYKYELYIRDKELIFNYLEENKPTIRVVHLPIDSFRYGFWDIENIIKTFREKYDCKKFVIHPNKGIEYFISKFNNGKIDFELCVENFQYKKKKRYRTPLDIIDVCIRNGSYIGMTLDTSHTDLIWFDHKILPYILKYTSVIHLSNRSTASQHIPFNSPDGELNLIGFVKDLKYRYDWSGDIVLEYLGEYSDKLQRNAQYIKTLIGEG